MRWENRLSHDRLCQRLLRPFLRRFLQQAAKDRRDQFGWNRVASCHLEPGVGQPRGEQALNEGLLEALYPKRLPRGDAPYAVPPHIRLDDQPRFLGPRAVDESVGVVVVL